jgi:type I restriction enzyme S subunit
MTEIQRWEHKRLTDLAEYINGYAFKPEDWGEEGLPIIRIEQLKNPASISDFYSGKLDEKNIIQDGDLIFSWSASLFLRIWQHGNAALNQHLFKVVEKEWVDRIFLKQFIEYYLPEITKASHGSTMQHITRKELDRFGALFPTEKPEQSKIAEVLSKVDQAIEQTESLIAKQQRIKTGLMQDLLTRGIDEHGNLRSEETHEFKNSPLGRIPVEWEVGNLSSYAELKGGFAFSSKQSQEFGIRWLKIANVSANRIVWDAEDFLPQKYLDTYREYALKTGDIVVALTRPVIRKELKIAQVSNCDLPSLLNQRVARVNLKQSTDISFLLNAMQSRLYVSQVEEAILGTDPPNISTNQMEEIVLPVIDAKEQQRQGVFIRNYDRKTATYLQHSKKLRSLKTALMQDLLTGKKRVTPLMKNMEVCS